MGMGVDINAGGEADEGGYKPLAEINITPMVDVMLVLLIIFMVAAPLMMAGVPVELPKTSAARASPAKKPMVVTLTADGRLQIRDEFVAKDAMAGRLREIKATEGDAVVYVRADKSIPYGDVMALLGHVGESGYARVSLLSQQIPAAAAAPAAAPAPAPAATP